MVIQLVFDRNPYNKQQRVKVVFTNQRHFLSLSRKINNRHSSKMKKKIDDGRILTEH